MTVATRPAARGLAFEIEDLVHVRGWAEQEGLVLRIRLDHVERGRDLEEVLFLAPLGRGLWRISMWRDMGGVVMRLGTHAPALYPSLEAALASARPRRRFRLWARARG